MVAPLRAGKTVKGAMAVWRTGGKPFADTDLEFLEGLSLQAAVAIENARLFAESQQRAAELATINTVSQQLAGKLELGNLIELVGEQIRTVFKADIAYVALYDRQTGMTEFPYQYGDKFVPQESGEGLTGKIIQSGKALIINKEADFVGTRIGRRARSYLGVPIMVGGTSQGAISVQSTQTEGVYDSDHERLLSTIAANVGVALQNAGCSRRPGTRSISRPRPARCCRTASTPIPLRVRQDSRQLPASVRERVLAVMLQGEDGVCFRPRGAARPSAPPRDVGSMPIEGSPDRRSANGAGAHHRSRRHVARSPGRAQAGSDPGPLHGDLQSDGLGRARHRRDLHPAAAAQAIQRQEGHAAQDLRRPSGDRHPERAAVQAGAGSTRRGRGGQRSQELVPRHHEPRDPQPMNAVIGTATCCSTGSTPSSTTTSPPSANRAMRC